MNLSANQSNLAIALKTVLRAVAARAFSPVLLCVRLEAKDGSLRLTSTDLTLSITVPIAAMIFTEGTVCVPAKLLAQFVDSLPSDAQVALESQERRLKLTSSGMKASFQTYPTDDFPDNAPDLAAAWTALLGASELRLALEQTVFAAANDETRPVLAGVNLRLDPPNKRVVLAAANSFMLAVSAAPVLDCRPTEPASVTIPLRTAKELASLLPESGSVTVTLSVLEGRTVHLAWGETRLWSTVVVGTFPSVAQIIPTSSPVTVSVPTSSLVRAARLASYVAPNELHSLRLAVSDGSLLVSAVGQSGDVAQEIAAEVTGDVPLTIGLNVDYVQAVLGAVATDRVLIGLSTPTSPATFRPTSESGQVGVIMPMHFKAPAAKEAPEAVSTARS